MSAYRVNEIFRSPQGEGQRKGIDHVFVRFSGCNMRCRMEKADDSPGGFDCDTEFVSGRTIELPDLIASIIAEDCYKQPFQCHWVCLTGGEPGLQVDRELIDTLHQNGYRIAIETNGSIELPGGIEYITVSPKVAEHAIRQKTANEIRYVRGYGQAIPKPACEAKFKFISPTFLGDQPDPRAVEWCQQLVKENPSWELSLQSHKLNGLR